MRIMIRKTKKIPLNKKEITLLICTLQASLDSARTAYTISSESERISAIESQREKAELINKLKKYGPECN
jgi:hypothetical protein